ncbi:hypothetical protein PWT90_03744 [Aphanocladium album]|nr:hypothetical protein PWT90_03744 [Aphanocladium album]
MAQQPSRASKDDATKTVVVRQRKTHRKSRLGCANCKLRGVKPGAGQAGRGGDAGVGAEAHDAQRLARNDKMLVSRFVHNTILTFGPGEADAHKSRCMMLANAHKYLYHIYIGFAQLQDAHFNLVPGSPRPSDGANMALHMYHSATMFKKTLSELMPRKASISSMERDALWMGASMLATSCFANIDSLDPREVWPMRAPDMMDLDWLRMNQGKDIVWDIADLGRSDSVFNDFYVEMGRTVLPSSLSPIRPHSLSPLFYTLFELTPQSAADGTNVYHGAVAYLSQVIDDQVSLYNGARLFVFPMEVGAGVKKLLRERDPRAMLILVYWHSKLVDYPTWWVKFRCIVEGLSIAMYLRRHHSDMADLLKLLEPPQQALLAHFWKSKLTQVWPQEVIDEVERPLM